MSTELYILDTPLEVTQNFKELKDQGLSFIQNHSGYEWTNLNASDPGVTILDQLCYALTELGYCNNFSIADILTRHDGTLIVKNQFYLPQDILTTSPVTTEDYIKYLVDGVNYVNNAVLLQATGIMGNVVRPIPKTYQPWLLINNAQVSADEVCWNAYVYLNKCRNLNELFKMPEPLQNKTIFISGNIEIQNKWQLSDIFQSIVTALSTYIFPTVVPQGYTTLANDNKNTNEIFNGPLLNNGWIPADSLGKKKDELSIYEVQTVIESVPGILSVTGLEFIPSTPINTTDSATKVGGNANQLIFIDIISSLTNGYIKVTCNNQELFNNLNGVKDASAQASSLVYQPTIIYGSAVNVNSDLPHGAYRDINSYYSIQNTFPAIYSVGPHSLSSNSTSFQIAQTRQLAGYLTLFDQVLANQFTQLANIDRLFSFKNSATGTPSDRRTFYARLSKLENKGLKYPVPFLQFSPTYFYQSLYEIPYIKPLLKDSDVFNFSTGLLPEKVKEEDSWKKYKQDPYNAYIRGLMEIMENESVNLDRRNEILNHLLARHGESPLLFDAYIEGSYYTKRTVMDKVIFKSLYLQNLGLLSYYRCKAYNFMAARKLNLLPLKTFTEWLKAEPLSPEEALKDDDTIDFIFNTEMVDRFEELNETDFINYSAIELKIHLLFGLQVYYRNFFEDCSYLEETTDEKKYLPADFKIKTEQALWFIEQRKGLILIELELLFKDFGFEFYLSSASQTWKLTSIKYGHIAQIASALVTAKDIHLLTSAGSFTIKTLSGEFTFEQTGYVTAGKLNASVLQPGFSYFVCAVNSEDSVQSSIQLPDFKNKLAIIFPAFVEPFNTPQFKTRLQLFLDNELPADCPYNFYAVGPLLLGPLIELYVLWHNSLIYDDKKGNSKDDEIKKHTEPVNIKPAWNLLKELIKVYEGIEA